LFFFLGMNAPALAAESWAADPATGGRIGWVSDTATLVAAKWTGPLTDGKAEGKGTLSITLRANDGKEFTGTADAEMKAGKLDGPVAFRWDRGDSFEGYYKEGLPEGKGVYKWAGGMSYEGDFKAGNFEGRGVMKWPSGIIYQGDWKAGLREGKGRVTYADGAVYEGDYKNDKREGTGVYRWPDGRTYEGDFKNNVQNGQGVMKDAAGKITYQGEFRDGNPVNQAGGQATSDPGKLTGFLGIAWDTAKADAEKLILARPNTRPWGAGDAQLVHFTGTYNDLPAVLSLEYRNGKFIRGCAWLPVDADDVGALFDKMKALLADKYGKPTKESGKYLDSQAEWQFPAPGIHDAIDISIARTDFFAKDQALSADRRKPFAVLINYYYGAAQVQKIQQQKQTGGKDL
jgi:hypothetical protein